MSTMMIGHRRIQIRAVLFVAVIFVLILIFTASSTGLHNRFPPFRPHIPSTSETTKSPNSSTDPTFDHTYDNIDKAPASGEKAHDPCVQVALKDGGTSPQKTDGTWVLVTGGAGFIGSNLVDRLLDLGYKVRVFDSLYTGFLRNVPLDDNRIEFVFGDIMDPKALERAVKGVDYVYHLAAMSKVVPSLKNPEMARFCVEVNALGTWNVLNAVRAKGDIKKVIYAASSTYYGNNKPPHSEEQAPDFLTPYAASKYEGELQMQMFDRLFSVQTISTRFFMVYGPRQPSTGAYAIVTGVFAKQAADGKQLTIEGDGSHYRDFIHVSDIVNGLILSQQSQDLHGNVVNLGTGTAFSVQDVADLVSKDQVHIDGRKNDLEGTLADTCRMKQLLNYKAKMDFTKEMSYMVKETMEGNVFMQKWLTPLHALSAPHLLAPGTPVFKWPKVQNDLDELISSLGNIDTASDNVERSITVIPFSLEKNDSWLFGDMLLNTIHSLVRFGGVTQYIVAPTDKAALELCIELNVPTYDAQTVNPADLLHTLLGLNFNVHFAQLGNSYVSPVQTFVQEASSKNGNADLIQATPFGDVFVRANENSRTASAAWSQQKPSLPANDIFVPATWPESLTLKRAKFEVSTLCKGSLGKGSATNTNDQKAKASEEALHPSAAYAAEAQPTSGLFQGKASPEKRAAPAKAPTGLCDSSRFYVPASCSTTNTKFTNAEAKTIKEALSNVELWHMTECEDKEHCDRQQTVPFRWVQSKPDLAATGGLC
ncbi:NAD(P)-binding protein [Pseudovirgaria hyperparasitica]|uniref:NAD(P)-binding protein n=1 Tax=Pseudovirgaria hyperparasitica TaxID=470096 RepID=A0A6A6W038_9PEZI|nr:NAD(P)-binding protein [Pseudovirgaria hyperparasitica]KAF2755456.1 NAD(P)-binding protein [Pseudovirgaria hyperparasitica]